MRRLGAKCLNVALAMNGEKGLKQSVCRLTSRALREHQRALEMMVTLFEADSPQPHFSFSMHPMRPHASHAPQAPGSSPQGAHCSTNP